MVGDTRSKSKGELNVNSYRREMLRLTQRFESDTGRRTYSAKDVARWMIDNNHWQAPETVAMQKCADDLARAWREQYTIDSQGRKVRVRHSFEIKSETGEQLHLWGYWENLKPKQMALSFQGRRKQIVGECRQLKNDVDSYNENLNTRQLPLPMSYNFTQDMVETERKRSTSSGANEPKQLSGQSLNAPRQRASERVLSRP